MDNTLYYGDNLDILKRYIPDEKINVGERKKDFTQGTKA